MSGEIYGAKSVTSATNVTLTTTTETVIVTSDPIHLTYPSQRFIIIAYVQLTTGAGTTTVTPRIRRTALVGGALVGEANAETIKVTAGGTEPFFIMVSEERTGVESVVYSLTLAQASATGDGTALQATILVIEA